MIACAAAKPKVFYLAGKLTGPNKIDIKRLLQERFTNLDNGICGTQPTKEITDQPLGFAKFAGILSHIPVATLEAAKSLWQHSEIWDEVLDIIGKAEADADSTPFARFKLKLSEALQKANVAPIFQNDVEPQFSTFLKPLQFGIMWTFRGAKTNSETQNFAKSFYWLRKS